MSSPLARKQISIPDHLSYDARTAGFNMTKQSIQSIDSYDSAGMTSGADWETGPRGFWQQLRFDRMGPERRAYHCSVVHGGKLYIHGGHDSKVGTMDNMWALDLSKIRALKRLVEFHKSQHQAAQSTASESNQSQLVP